MEDWKKTNPQMILKEEEKGIISAWQRFVDRLYAELALTKEEKDLLKPDYKTNEDGHATLSSVLFPIFVATGLTLEHINARVEELDDELLYGYFISETEGEDRQPGISLAKDEFLRKVLSEPTWHAEDKCHIVEIFIDFKQNYKQAVSVLERLIHLIEAHLAELDPAIAKWDSFMRTNVEQGKESDFFKLLIENVPLLEREDKVIVVRPSFAEHGDVQITITGSTDQQENRMFPGHVHGLIAIGLHVTSLQGAFASAREMSDTNLMYACKLLSDKSKFEILCVLRDESCYGAQLASRLGLSAATISHHMNALFSNQLVAVDDRDNKLYYTINVHQIERVVNKLQQTFLR